MIDIYTTTEAKNTILRRDNSLIDPVIPEGMQRGIERVFGERIGPDEGVRRILRDVRQRGDAALRDWTEKIDGLKLEALKVDEEWLKTAVSRIPAGLAKSLHIAADRIRQFHQHQPLPSWETEALGGRLGQKVTPLSRIGVYVPGGTAPLPSSLLMSVIPAQVAGVPDIVVATPLGRPNGQVPDVTLAAAAIAGIDTVYTLGGAQAVAALAFGTETIPRVDKIVGPGNLFTTLAKQQVYGIVGIDGLYGPTETIVIADETAVPAWVASDLLAQAEHDVVASAILLTPSRRLAKAVQIEVAKQAEQLSRDEIIVQSLANKGGIVITADLAEAAALADEYAPEHLCIATANPRELAKDITHSGGIFFGERSFEVLGDYVAGPSHVMPTNGTARFASPLSAVDFVRITSIIDLDDATSATLSKHAARIAQAEQLTAHAAAALKRVERD